MFFKNYCLDCNKVTVHDRDNNLCMDCAKERLLR